MADLHFKLLIFNLDTLLTEEPVRNFLVNGLFFICLSKNFLLNVQIIWVKLTSCKLPLTWYATLSSLNKLPFNFTCLCGMERFHLFGIHILQLSTWHSIPRLIPKPKSLDSATSLLLDSIHSFSFNWVNGEPITECYPQNDKIVSERKNEEHPQTISEDFETNYPWRGIKYLASRKLYKVNGAISIQFSRRRLFSTFNSLPHRKCGSEMNWKRPDRDQKKASSWFWILILICVLVLSSNSIRTSSSSQFLFRSVSPGHSSRSTDWLD